MEENKEENRDKRGHWRREERERERGSEMSIIALPIPTAWVTERCLQGN